MNRIIKFRAWDNKNKYMCGAEYGDWISFDGVPYTAALKYDTPNTEIEMAKDYTMMQFTGLHDKNGKEIYEGDIVNAWHKDRANYRYPAKHSVVFNSEHLSFGLLFQGKTNYTSFSSHGEIEIIGNIHQNPELLPC